MAHLETLIAFFVEEHGAKMLHAAFTGQRPDELYFGAAKNLPGEPAFAGHGPDEQEGSPWPRSPGTTFVIAHGPAPATASASAVVHHVLDDRDAGFADDAPAFATRESGDALRVCGARGAATLGGHGALVGRAVHHCARSGHRDGVLAVALAPSLGQALLAARVAFVALGAINCRCARSLAPARIARKRRARHDRCCHALAIAAAPARALDPAPICVPGARGPVGRVGGSGSA